MPLLPKPTINLEVLPSPSLPRSPIASHKDTVWPHFSDSQSEDHCIGALSQPWDGEALDAEERKPPDQAVAYSIPSRLLSCHNSAWLLCFSKPKPKNCTVLVCSLDLQFCEIWSGHMCSAFFLVVRLPRTAAVTLCDRQEEQSSLLCLRVLSDLCAHRGWTWLCGFSFAFGLFSAREGRGFGRLFYSALPPASGFGLLSN